MFHNFLRTAAKTILPGPFYNSLAEKKKIRHLRSQFNEWSGEDEKRLVFYRQFISPGSLVFDVGANVGNRSKIFYKLGARVVAVEPQRFCADFLEIVFNGYPNFCLVRTALGSSVGTAEMMTSDASVVSSLSPDWIRSVKESGRFADFKWSGKETVPIDTLDNLISRHGLPAFVKVDVEGFEDQVLSGLSVPVPVLSFEFTPEFMGSTIKCIEHLCKIGNNLFQISYGESMEFALPLWVGVEEIKKTLSECPKSAFGDIYSKPKP